MLIKCIKPNRIWFVFILLSAIFFCGAAIAEEATSNLSEGISKEQKELELPSDLKPYKENYFLPIVLGSEVEGRDVKEAKFQFSLKKKLFNSDWYFGYTQKSFWQIYDSEHSRPFRESNYNPEVYWQSDICTKGNHELWGDVGLWEHESNGGGVATSRSWDRSYVRLHYENEKSLYGQLFGAELKLWNRWSESAKKSTNDPGGDDNPRILDYSGNGEIKLRYGQPEGFMVTLFGRGNPKTDKGAFQADLSLPWFYLHMQYWTGYGESLIDYNRNMTRYGIGFIFNH